MFESFLTETIKSRHLFNNIQHSLKKNLPHKIKSRWKRKSPGEKPSEKTIFPEEHATSTGLITDES